MRAAGGDDAGWRRRWLVAVVSLVVGVRTDRLPRRTAHHSLLQRARHPRTSSSRSSLAVVGSRLGTPGSRLPSRRSSHAGRQTPGPFKYNTKLIRRRDTRTWHGLRLTPPTNGFPSPLTDDLRKILHGGWRVAKVQMAKSYWRKFQLSE